MLAPGAPLEEIMAEEKFEIGEGGIALALPPVYAKTRKARLDAFGERPDPFGVEEDPPLPVELVEDPALLMIEAETHRPLEEPVRRLEGGAEERRRFMEEPHPFEMMARLDDMAAFGMGCAAIIEEFAQRAGAPVEKMAVKKVDEPGCLVLEIILAAHPEPGELSFEEMHMRILFERARGHGPIRATVASIPAGRKEEVAPQELIERQRVPEHLLAIEGLVIMGEREEDEGERIEILARIHHRPFKVELEDKALEAGIVKALFEIGSGLFGGTPEPRRAARGFAEDEKLAGTGSEAAIIDRGRPQIGKKPLMKAALFLIPPPLRPKRKEALLEKILDPLFHGGQIAEMKIQNQLTLPAAGPPSPAKRERVPNEVRRVRVAAAGRLPLRPGNHRAIARVEGLQPRPYGRARHGDDFARRCPEAPEAGFARLEQGQQYARITLGLGGAASMRDLHPLGSLERRGQRLFHSLRQHLPEITPIPHITPTTRRPCV